ncbi:MAG: septum formation inhibitor Maf [Planctomycetes bacterium]|nr:septum formation inhibitor Maf [Planctomycetota bacterium]
MRTVGLIGVGVVVAALVVWAVPSLGRPGSEPEALAKAPTNRTADASFGSYWFAGKAEVNRFELEQSRYGELHPGHAMMIFVTEDFLPDRQVKADDADRRRSGAWPVLKLNATKSFNTGLYPYSLMTSTFTPIESDRHPRTLKSTTSVQEWCGHVFLQFNRKDDGYRARGLSYFQSEGDQDVSIEADWLEDEVWNRIRLDPGSLPTGTFRMIPSGQFLRLRHRPLEAVSARGTLSTDDDVQIYRLEYPGENRTLTIRFGAEFPHRIEGWEEVGVSGFGPNAKTLTTRATRTHTEMLDYWNHHDRSDTPLRAKLGL